MTTLQPNPYLQALGDTSQVRNKLMPPCLPLAGTLPSPGTPLCPDGPQAPKERQAGSPQRSTTPSSTSCIPLDQLQIFTWDKRALPILSSSSFQKTKHIHQVLTRATESPSQTAAKAPI